MNIAFGYITACVVVTIFWYSLHFAKKPQMFEIKWKRVDFFFLLKPRFDERLVMIHQIISPRLNVLYSRLVFDKLKLVEISI
jgi:hypothetical protein